MSNKLILDEIKLYQITKEEASNLFDNGIVIYIQAEDTNLAHEGYNTFMLSKNTWDASLNIYKQGLTPMQYGFDNIINWINDRTNNIPLFYTYNSTKFLNIDNN